MARKDSQMNYSDFDLDFRYGQDGELYVNNLLQDPLKTVECKRDSRWIDTGNIFIETENWSNAINEWRKSGLSISKATHWSFILEEMVIIVPIDTLKKATREYGRPIEMAIEPNPSRGYLITINALIMAMKGGE